MNSVPDSRTFVLHAALEPDLSRIESILSEHRYRDYFCENFSRLAPEAWTALLTLEPLVAQFVESLVAVAHTGTAHDPGPLEDAITNWSHEYRLDADWLRLVALLTLSARWIARREGLPADDGIHTLDWSIRITITTDPSVNPWPVSFTRGEYVDSIEFRLLLHDETFTRDPIREGRAAFRKRVQAELAREIDHQLDASGLP
ncbi:MAG TPA: hypothetical protein VNP95_09205, partial [Thermomicrobiales bacterium]|nr:hypothetical protein [Thermomicrobiales bacterium]